MVKKIMSKLHRQVYKKRMAGLGDIIIPQLSAGNTVLDVGCGFGEFGAYINQNTKTAAGVKVTGAEKYVRPNTLIEVKEIAASNIPFDDNSFDCVMILDVLHHEENWTHLLNECIRVSRNLVIIKDHQVTTKISYYKICLLDWLANKPYNIVCPYRYFKAKEWRDIFKEKQLTILREEQSLKLYPFVYQVLFPGKLQYFAVLKKAVN